jgi:hypothetical protein
MTKREAMIEALGRVVSLIRIQVENRTEGDLLGDLGVDEIDSPSDLTAAGEKIAEACLVIANQLARRRDQYRLREAD